MIIRNRPERINEIVIKFFYVFLVFFLYNNESFSLTDYQIKRFCSKDKRVTSCIKNLKEKRSDLQKGKLIEIPVTPYKR